MTRKTPPRRRQAAARALADGRFRLRIVKSRKLYSRKGRVPKGRGPFAYLALNRRALAPLAWLSRQRPRRARAPGPQAPAPRPTWGGRAKPDRARAAAWRAGAGFLHSMP